MARPDERRALDQLDQLDQIDDGFVRGAVRASLHLRKYLPFYVFTGVWVLMLALFPTIGRLGEDVGSFAGGGNVSTGGRTGGSSTGAATRSTAGGGGTETTVSGGAKSGPGAGARAAGSGGASAAPGETALAPEESLAASQDASGTARSGVACSPGVRQIPQSSYATQCTKTFEGSNGGAVTRGVTDTEIIIVRRTFPESANSRAAEELNRRAGFADPDVADRVRDELIGYFNTAYELYGRQVKIVEYESENGDSTEEVQGRGREGACADATKIANELQAFGTIDGGSAPFAECAAERGLVVFDGAGYYPEQFYEKFHPFIWHRVMECERISYQVAEYVGKRLLDRPAKWSADTVMQQQDRKFGTYVPDNDGYQHCVQISEDELKQEYGGEVASRYNYQLDLSRFPDQAAQAAVQFKADGVTTVILACDPYSVIFLTQAAARQQWYPEWYIIGVAAQDTDNFGRLYDQEEVDGHLFGMSQLGRTEDLIGPNSEAGRVYKQASGKDMPEGTSGDYYESMSFFNLLQAAGPTLTPDTIAQGAMTIPPGGAPDFPAGYWSLQDGPDGSPGAGDHTLVDDSREIYWDGKATAPDGDQGTYLETYDGQRFRNGEWPEEEPPIYPDS
jgi:hypothetical protein